MTLEQALSQYGVWHCSDAFSCHDGRQVLFYGDYRIGRFNAEEGWQYLHEVIEPHVAKNS